MQETVAGIVICAIGSVLYLAPMHVWKLTEKWKHENEAQPSDTYVKVVRTIGIVMVAAGLIVSTGLFK